MRIQWQYVIMGVKVALGAAAASRLTRKMLLPLSKRFAAPVTAMRKITSAGQMISRRKHT